MEDLFNSRSTFSHNERAKCHSFYQKYHTMLTIISFETYSYEEIMDGERLIIYASYQELEFFITYDELFSVKNINVYKNSYKLNLFHENDFRLEFEKNVNEQKELYQNEEAVEHAMVLTLMSMADIIKNKLQGYVKEQELLNSKRTLMFEIIELLGEQVIPFDRRFVLNSLRLSLRELQEIKEILLSEDD